MKKARTQKRDELRREYKRSDFGAMVRGKYTKRIAAATNIVILEPEIAKAFPNDKIVNDTLRSLLRLATATSRPARTKKNRASA
jgi:hypothetical protein